VAINYFDGAAYSTPYHPTDEMILNIPHHFVRGKTNLSSAMSNNENFPLFKKQKKTKKLKLKEFNGFNLTIFQRISMKW